MGLRPIALSLFCLAMGCGEAERPVPTPLRMGESIEQRLGNGDHHDFSLMLEAGSLLKALALQKQVDLTLTLIAPDGDSIAFSDSHNGRDGPEWLLHEVVHTGRYRLRVQGIDGAGNFELSIDAIASPTAEDVQLRRALAVLAAGGPLHAIEDLSTAATKLPGLLQARLRLLHATLLRAHGQPLEALPHLEGAVEGFVRHGNAYELAPTLNTLGYLQLEVGRHLDAESTLLLALETAAQVEQWPATRVAWNNLGILYSAAGDHSAALDAYGRAQEVQTLLDDPEGMADSLHNIGLELIFLGRFTEGTGTLRRAVQARRELGDALGEARSMASFAWGLGAQSLAEDTQRADCLEAFEQATQALETLGARHDLAIALEQRGRLRHRWGDLDGAVQDLQYALSLSPDADRLHTAWLSLGLGGVLRSRGENEPSRRRLLHAVAEFDALDHAGGRITGRAELARTLRTGGDDVGGDEALREALRIIENSRSNLHVPTFRSTFLGGRQEIYAELTDLWAEAAWRDPQNTELARRALAAAERGKARSLLDTLAADGDPAPSLTGTQGELRQTLSALETERMLHGSSVHGSESTGHRASLDAIREARFKWLQARERAGRHLAPPISSTPLDAPEILSLLDPETTLLMLSLGPERSWLFLVTHNTLGVFPLASRSQLEGAAVRAYALLPLAGTPGYATAARLATRRLAELLLEPVWAELKGKRLVVVPDGALNLIPFGLLRDPGGTPLLQHFEIAHLPSASVLAHLGRRRRTRPPADHAMALIADPVFNPLDPRLETAVRPRVTETHGYLRRLPATGEEAESIATLARRRFGEPIPMFRAFEARRELLTQGELNDFRVLHFATHGWVDPDDPALAGLVFSLYGPNGEPRPGFLPVRDLFELKLGADLVALSACRTAIGRPVRGEGLVGLGHGFLAAGAGHVVVSLWDVDDRATAALMHRFYRILFEQGLDPAGALRLAQLELQAQGTWSAAQWGAFIALGDWRQKID